MINKDGDITKITGDAYTLVPYEILIGIGVRALLLRCLNVMEYIFSNSLIIQKPKTKENHAP